MTSLVTGPLFHPLYHSVSAPTCVDHSLYCHMISDDEKNLILIGGAHLRAFRLVDIDDSGKKKLDCILTMDFYEPVEAAQCVRFSHSNRDSVVLAFSEARMSILSYDPLSHTLKTVSLHNYENDELRLARRQFTSPMLLRADPESRCIVMLVYDHFLAVLPIRRDAYSSAAFGSGWLEGCGGNEFSIATHPSYLINLLEAGERISQVLDMQFLHGYYEPTLFILYEPIGTWAGRVSARNDTCAAATLSLNMTDRVSPVIWSLANLPYDCRQVVALPKPIGGVILLAVNSLLYLNQSQPPYGINLNSNSVVNFSTSFPLKDERCGPSITLDTAKYVVLNFDQLLISLRGGELIVLNLQIDLSMRSVIGFRYEKCVTTVSCETMSIVADDHLLLGSRTANSVLLRFSPKPLPDEEEPGAGADSAGVAGGEREQDNGPVGMEEDAVDGELAPEAEGDAEAGGAGDVAPEPAVTCNGDANATPRPTSPDAIDVEMYGLEAATALTNMNSTDLAADSAAATSRGATERSNWSYTFELCDSLFAVGPISQVTAGEIQGLSTDFANNAQKIGDLTDVEMVVTSGWGRSGAVSLLQRSVRPQLQTTFELPGYSDAWVLSGPVGGRRREQEPSEEAEAAPGVEPEPGERMETDAAGGAAAPGSGEGQPSGEIVRDAYMILSRIDSTMILEATAEIIEIEHSGFCTSEPTYFAGNLADCRFIVQVTRRTVYLLEGWALVERLDLAPPVGPDGPDGPSVERACLAEPYLLVLMDDRRALLLHFEECRDATGRPSLRMALREVRAGEQGFGQSARVSACTVYVDRSRFFSLARVAQPAPGGVMTREDLALYGESAFVDSPTAAAQQQQQQLAHQRSAPVGSAAIALGIGFDAIEDEDLLLYGEDDDCKEEPREGNEVLLGEWSAEPNGGLASVAGQGINGPADGLGEAGGGGGAAGDSYSFFPEQELCLAFVCYENGTLEVFQMPDFNVVYTVTDFHIGPRVLIDAACVSGGGDSSLFGQSRRFSSRRRTTSLRRPTGDSGTGGSGTAPTSGQAKAEEEDEEDDEDEDVVPTVEELLIFTVGRLRERPVLLARTTDELMIYEGFRCPVQVAPVRIDGRLEVRWRRQESSILLRSSKRVRQTDAYERAKMLMCRPSINHLRPFENINGHRGVFLCGTQPYWLFFSQIGPLHTFPMNIDGVVTSWAPFDKPYCPQGFFYFTLDGDMRIACLPTGYSYEGPLACRKVTVRATVRFVQYHINSKTYVLITSQADASSKVTKLNSEGDKELEFHEKDPFYVLPQLDKYALQLYDAEAWEQVPSVPVEFEDWERVSAMTSVRLRSQETWEGLKDFLAVGSNLAYGEEIPCRGRIILFDIIEVVPEPGKPLTRHKMKILYDQEQKGPVTAISSVQGFLVSAIGQKVYIWDLKDSDLIGVAFVDSQIYIHSLHSLKNMILTADIMKSIQLLRFQEKMRVLSTVTRDLENRQVVSAQFYVDGRHLGFVLVDTMGNLLLQGYHPQEKQAGNSVCKQLQRVSEMRLPSRCVSDILRVQNRLRDACLPERSAALESPAHTLYMGCSDGAILALTPAPGKMLSRLLMVEKHLWQNMDHPAGLHPRGSRQFKPLVGDMGRALHWIGDLDVARKYVFLSHEEKVEVAKKAGLSVRLLLDDFAELQASLQHF